MATGYCNHNFYGGGGGDAIFSVELQYFITRARVIPG